MTVLIIGFVMLALLVSTVVMAASSLYIEHKKLLSLADGASVAAADYLSRNGAVGRVDGLAVAAGTGTPDGSTAVVVLSATVHPPVVNFLIPNGITIAASSTARSRLTR